MNTTPALRALKHPPVLLVAAALLCGATAQRASPVEELMTASGLHAAVAAAARGIPDHAATNKAAERLEPAQAQRFRQTLAEVFGSARLQAQVLKALKAQVTAQDAELYLGFFTSPTGKRLVAMEVSADTGAPGALEAYASTLQDHPPPPSRIAQVRRLEAAVKSAAFSVGVVNAVSLGLVRGMGQVNPKLQVPDERLRATAEKMGSELEQQLEAATLLHTLFTYRDATDAEMEAAIAWHTSKGGRAFRQASQAAVLGVVSAAAVEAGRTLAKLQKESAAARKGPAPRR